VHRVVQKRIVVHGCGLDWWVVDAATAIAAWERREIGKYLLLSRHEAVDDRLRFRPLQGNWFESLVVVVCMILRCVGEPPPLGFRAAGAQASLSIAICCSVFTLLEELRLLSFPRGNLGTECVADLVAGRNDGNFFPHAVLEFEKAATIVDLDNPYNLLGHAHLLLFGSGIVILVSESVQNVLEGSIARVARTDAGLPAKNVAVGGHLDPVGCVAIILGSVAFSSRRCHLGWSGYDIVFLHGNASWQITMNRAFGSSVVISVVVVFLLWFLKV